LPTCPSPPKFGLVSHEFLRPPPATARNWVRFARFTVGRQPAARDWVCSAHLPSGRAKLGSFRASCLRHSSAAGIFQSAIYNPQSAIAGGSRPTNWLCLPVRKTAHNSHNPFTTNDFARIPAGANWLCSASFLSRPPAKGPGLRVPPARMSLRGPTRSGATRRGRRSNLNRGSWGVCCANHGRPLERAICCLLPTVQGSVFSCDRNLIVS
jgi:hypothetical protein